MTKKQIIRLVLFCLFACVLPFVFIAWRFEIFSKVNHVSLTGWGLIGVIIALVFVIYITRSIAHIKEHSMFKQCFIGYMSVVVPLLVLYFLLYSLRNNMDIMLQSLIVVIACESVAIPINPIPEITQEKNVNFITKIYHKMKGDDE